MLPVYSETMFGKFRSESIVKLFSDQFEPDGADFVYRKYMKGEAIRVSAGDRDAFIAGFRRRWKFGLWMVMTLAVLLIVGLGVLVSFNQSPESDFWLYGGLGAIIFVLLAFQRWAWNAPMRELERHPVSGPALSRDEVRKLNFSRVTYRQLALVPVAAIFIVFSQSSDTDVLHGWGILWTVAGVSLVALAAVQAFRKWRFERSQRQ